MVSYVYNVIAFNNILQGNINANREVLDKCQHWQTLTVALDSVRAKGTFVDVLYICCVFKPFPSLFNRRCVQKPGLGITPDVFNSKKNGNAFTRYILLNILR